LKLTQANYVLKGIKKKKIQKPTLETNTSNNIKKRKLKNKISKTNS